jgi:hypothetical protein
MCSVQALIRKKKVYLFIYISLFSFKVRPIRYKKEVRSLKKFPARKKKSTRVDESYSDIRHFFQFGTDFLANKRIESYLGTDEDLETEKNSNSAESDTFVLLRESDFSDGF